MPAHMSVDARTYARGEPYSGLYLFAIHMRTRACHRQQRCPCRGGHAQSVRSACTCRHTCERFRRQSTPVPHRASTPIPQFVQLTGPTPRTPPQRCTDLDSSWHRRAELRTDRAHLHTRRRAHALVCRNVDGTISPHPVRHAGSPVDNPVSSRHSFDSQPINSLVQPSFQSQHTHRPVQHSSKDQPSNIPTAQSFHS